MSHLRTMRDPVIVALLACFILSGCASPRSELTIYDSPRGTVYLEGIRDPSFQATHPITLNSGTIARALRGIHVRDNRNTLQTLLASKPAAMRIFSDDEADFLAPLITSAFAKAEPDQRVGFRIAQTGIPSRSQKEDASIGSSKPPLPSAQNETTSGTLFAYGRSLQINLTAVRPNSQKPSMIDGPNRHYSDQTGLTGRELMFFPKQAQRPDTFRVGETEAPTIVIDYELLAGLPDQPVESAPASSASASPVQPAATAQEVEELKKELREIKRQLAEQQSRKDGPKQKNKPASTQ